VLWAASYTAWAEVDLLHAAAIDNPIRLQGQYADPETGLYYNRHRYFCPHAGQFISQDPLGLAPGENPYQFAENCLWWIDPHGLAKCSKITKQGSDTVLCIKNKFKPGSPEARQLARFIKAWNEQVAANGGKMTKRGALSEAEEAASAAWKKAMRDRYPARFDGKVVGHTPDAIMGGKVAGGKAMALTPSVNSYLGGVAGGIPEGTTYTKVVLFR
jgi:RHS repeat-associated protein